MKLGKSFIDTFSNNLQQDRNKKANSVEASPVQPETKLSTKTGINRKKSTQLQQNMIQVIQAGSGQAAVGE